MEKHTGYALFLLRMESELLKSREVCIELHDGINEYKHEIIAELFNEGYIDGVSPGKGPYLCCTLSNKAMVPLLHNPPKAQTKDVAKRV